MAAASVRNVILAQLATDVQGLTVANGYSQTVRTVRRDNPGADEVATDPLPAVYLYAGDEAKLLEETTAQFNELELIVVFITEAPTTTQESVATDFLADVEQLLVTPNARSIGGTLVDILARSAFLSLGTPDDTKVSGQMLFTITYRTLLAQPRVGA